LKTEVLQDGTEEIIQTEEIRFAGLIYFGDSSEYSNKKYLCNPKPHRPAGAHIASQSTGLGSKHISTALE
jgi:hypothetical protein